MRSSPTLLSLLRRPRGPLLSDQNKGGLSHESPPFIFCDRVRFTPLADRLDTVLDVHRSAGATGLVDGVDELQGV